MSVVGSNILAGSSGQSTGYDVPYSIKTINGDRITRTMTETGAATPYFTYSTWFKKSDPATHQFFLWWQAKAVHANAVVELAQNSDSVWRFNLWTGASSEADRYSTEKYRDPSAWYHWVVQWNGATFAMYVNNELVTMTTTGSITGSSWGLQSGDIMRIASSDAATSTLGYTAETYFIEGQTLAPSNFAELNEDTGQWVPIEYEGTFSGNSFYLDYADSSDLGKDVSGLGNDFTVSGAIDANSQVIDSPTNNFCTMNPLAKASDSYNTLKEGNLHLEATGQGSVLSTFAMSSGKWYWECLVTIEPTWWPVVGFCKTTAAVGVGNQNYTGEQTGSWGYLTETGVWYVDGSTSSTYTAVSAGDIMQFAIDMDAGKAWAGINNTWVNSGNPSTGANAIVTSGLTGDITPAFSDSDSAGHDLVANFGQDSSFAGAKTAQGNGGDGEDFYYTPPTGFKALNTDNLDDPAIALPTDHFDTSLVSGSGSARSITGLNFQPDFLWGKSRTNTLNHYLTDSVRGVNSQLYSDGTGAQGTETVIYTAFNSDGFSLGTGDMNTSGQNYANWCWKGGGTASTNEDGSIDSEVSANPTAGFSIVNWNGTEASATIGHGLSQAPELIIVKDVDSARSWPTNIENITGTANQYLFLDTTAEQATSAAYWGGTPGASVFTVGDSANTNDDASMIAYCFHSVEGYSKVGSYAGNGATDGVFIYTGFRPAYVMTKCFSGSSTQEWVIVDNKRSSFNEVDKYLDANDNGAESTSGNIDADFVSNGIKFRSAGGASNASGRSYIYLVFAESPFKYSNAR